MGALTQVHGGAPYNSVYLPSPVPKMPCCTITVYSVIFECMFASYDISFDVRWSQEERDADCRPSTDSRSPLIRDVTGRRRK